MSPHNIVEYIKSIDRVGCAPFEFISEDSILNEYTEFELVELEWDTPLVNWSLVEQYNPSPIDRINRKINSVSRRRYYIHKVYNDPLLHPVVLGNGGTILDGSHRLCCIHHNKLTFRAWIPVST